jgi:hypothetical protein
MKFQQPLPGFARDVAVFNGFDIDPALALSAATTASATPSLAIALPATTAAAATSASTSASAAATLASALPPAFGATSATKILLTHVLTLETAEAPPSI